MKTLKQLALNIYITLKANDMGKLGIIIWCTISWVCFSSFSNVPYEWKNQQLYFKLPDHFIEKKNNDLAFEAQGNQMSFHINVYMDDLISKDALESFVSKIANEQYNIESSQESGQVIANGCTGRYLCGYADGELRYILGLIDNNSGIAYYGMIRFSEEKSDTKIIAENILNSLNKKS